MTISECPDPPCIEWFDVYPPTVEELAESFAKHTKA